MFGLFDEKLLCSACHHRKTRRKNEAGEPVCDECEIDLRIKSEPRRICPVDQSAMEKEVLLDGDLIIDRCPACKGVWLDHEELETIKDEAESDSSSQFAMGLAIGIAT